MSGARSIGAGKSKKRMVSAHLDVGVRFIGVLNICDNAEKKSGI